MTLRRCNWLTLLVVMLSASLLAGCQLTWKHSLFQGEPRMKKEEKVQVEASKPEADKKDDGEEDSDSKE